MADKAYYDGEFFEPYEEECPSCEGLGELEEPDILGETKCRNCKGEGYCLSWEGERFLQFLKRNLRLRVT